jgi:hypothetical protein
LELALLLGEFYVQLCDVVAESGLLLCVSTSPTRSAISGSRWSSLFSGVTRTAVLA